MKKVFLLLLALLFVPTLCFAAPQTIDLDTMTLEELKSLQANVAAAITKSSSSVVDGYTVMESYDDYARNPDGYVGDSVRFNGTVVQVIEGVEANVYRISFGRSSDDILYVTYTPEANTHILEEDRVTVLGTFTGLTSYESTLGGTITIPAVAADTITDEVTETAEYPATREDPAPVGATVRYDGSSYSNETITDFTITQVVRGDAAWKIIRNWNRFNDKPGSSQEYVLVYVKAQAIESLDSKAATINDYYFDFISESGRVYDRPFISGLEPALTDIYEGAECEGIVAGLVDIGDNPRLVYLPDSDVPVWFDLNKSVPIVIPDDVVLTTLQKGDKNADVLQLQAKLIELGYLTGTADGDFGNKTATAVSQYQTDMGLEPTGIADDATLRLILTGQKPQ